MTHVQLIQHITIHFCGSSSTALGLVNTCFGKQLLVLQPPAFTASTAQPTSVLRAATVLNRAVVTCRDSPLQHLCLVWPWLKQHTQPQKQKPFLGHKSRHLNNDLSAFTLQHNSLQCLGFDSWKGDDYFYRRKECTTK